MKVLVKSDRVPLVLMIMGSIMVMVSSLEYTVRNDGILFILGWALAVLGFLLWAVPATSAYVKRKSRRARPDRGTNIRPQMRPRQGRR